MAFFPSIPGVPPLLGGASVGAAVGLATLAADTIMGLGGLFGQQWGIFLFGFPIVLADTVVDLSFKREWIISDYPLEQGAFETYDKVAVPFDIRVRFVAGGSDINKTLLLTSIAAIAGDMNLYDVATPNAVYRNCNVRHYDYSRSSTKGLGLLTVDVWLQEIRQNFGSFTGGGSADPSGADASAGGSVQAPTATPAEASAAAPGPSPAPSGSSSGMGWSIQ